MRRTVYEMIFSRLQEIGILDENGIMQSDYMKFTSPGLMDLNVDKLTSDTIALAHNGKQNGDVMADPDVEVRIYPELKMAEALTLEMITLGSIKRYIQSLGNTIQNSRRSLMSF